MTVQPWDVAAWAESRLPAESVASLRRARREAAEALLAEVRCGDEPSARLRQEAGLPGQAAARALLDQAMQTLWAA